MELMRPKGEYLQMDGDSDLSERVYSQLQTLFEEIGREIRPAYAGNKVSSERMRRAITKALAIIREYRRTLGIKKEVILLWLSLSAITKSIVCSEYCRVLPLVHSLPGHSNNSISLHHFCKCP